MQQYQVTGEIAFFTADTSAGRIKTAVYRHGMVPVGATADEIAHHLSIGFIKPVGQPAEAESVYGPVPIVSTPVVEPAAVVTAEQQAAQADLPPDGSTPKVPQPKAVWVEFAVKRGYDRAAAEGVTKQELIDLFKV